MSLTAYIGPQKRHNLADKQKHSSSVIAGLKKQFLAESAKIRHKLAGSAFCMIWFGGEADTWWYFTRPAILRDPKVRAIPREVCHEGESVPIEDEESLVDN
jgi:hypothetical protein